MPDATSFPFPCLLILLINLPLLLSSTLLLSLALWLSCKPNQSIPQQLLGPLQLSLVLTCLIAGGCLVIVAALGIWAAARVKRYSTATVSSH